MPRRGFNHNLMRRAGLAEAVEKIQLDNALTVLLCPRPALAQSYVAVYFGVGSRHEDLADNGITHVLEHMLFRGTRSYPDATVLNAAAEAFGGYLEGATYRDHLVFATSCHPSALGEAIDILGELVQTPRYRAMDVEKEILREELLETMDRDGRMVDMDNITHASIFGHHSLGWPIEGQISTIERLEKQDLERHRRRFLVGANAVVSVAGPMEVRETAALVRRAFGSLPAGALADCAPPPAPRQEPVLRYVRNASSQVDVRLSFRAVPVCSPEYPALVLLARLLADGLASRMHAELVDRRGLAYALQAGLTSYTDCGLFDFEITVAPDKAAEAVAALLDFAAGAGRFRFSREEMQRTLRRFRYSIEFMGDDSSDLASWFGRAALFGIEDEVAALERRIATLDLAAIHTAARRFFRREGLVITAVGELARGEWGRIKRVVDRFGR
jgi:predicted Zn-dependent peptidase